MLFRSGSYAKIIEKLRPGSAEAGEIVHEEGYVVGKHKGIIHYTVGQRRGIGVSWDTPLYVLKLDADKRQVIVGPKESLSYYYLFLKEINWLGCDSIFAKKNEKYDLSIRVRSSQCVLYAATLVLREDNEGVIILKDVEYGGISPGQACVFYQGTQVLGGGWIVRAQQKKEIILEDVKID